MIRVLKKSMKHTKIRIQKNSLPFLSLVKCENHSVEGGANKRKLREVVLGGNQQTISNQNRHASY